ncbi:ergothioneine biosynthesis glutamate--cysteine ligase EgtA [Actinocrispum sp. NPDC049592]|uniref:ergothioneine biosynthesis glutamate--cysteine ligase EgtA n=1 Tax=Actinocrispum sp. NPDC049592 TaxID=3154835 RepID=UPI00341FD504
MHDTPVDEPGHRLRDRVEAEAYVASVCFKHGPPRLVGVELEWTVHHVDDPSRPLTAEVLSTALGPHAPRTLSPESPQEVLPGGSPLSMEPGGQVEISALPQDSLAGLHATAAADTRYLSDLLATHGLALGTSAIDPFRTPRRVLDTPRYSAMEKAFAPLGTHGVTMMCNTAGFQVCVDAGEAGQMAARWAAVHALGPPMIALFANSPVMLGRDTGWASNRSRAVLNTDPVRSFPSVCDDDPAASWARRVLDTPLLCLRRPGDSCWEAPAGVTFADWIAGALDRAPTLDDLDYHISTLFPPVRAQGYLEVRYIDAQPGDRWLAPAALLLALLSTSDTVARVLDVCAPVADCWEGAARHGLRDEKLARVVEEVAAMGLAALDLPAAETAAVTGDIEDRLRKARA